MKLGKARLNKIINMLVKRAERAHERPQATEIERVIAYWAEVYKMHKIIGHALAHKHKFWEERRILYGYGDGKAPRKAIRA